MELNFTAIKFGRMAAVTFNDIRFTAIRIEMICKIIDDSIHVYSHGAN